MESHVVQAALCLSFIFFRSKTKRLNLYLFTISTSVKMQGPLELSVSLVSLSLRHVCLLVCHLCLSIENTFLTMSCHVLYQLAGLIQSKLVQWLGSMVAFFSGIQLPCCTSALPPANWPPPLLFERSGSRTDILVSTVSLNRACNSEPLQVGLFMIAGFVKLSSSKYMPGIRFIKTPT